MSRQMGSCVLTLKCWGVRSKSQRGKCVQVPACASFDHPSTKGDGFVSRALRNQSLWLTLTYVGLILLMARAYA
jgi:hypothetical protein